MLNLELLMLLSALVICTIVDNSVHAVSDSSFAPNTVERNGARRSRKPSPKLEEVFLELYFVPVSKTINSRKEIPSKQSTTEFVENLTEDIHSSRYEVMNRDTIVKGSENLGWKYSTQYDNDITRTKYLESHQKKGSDSKIQKKHTDNAENQKRNEAARNRPLTSITKTKDDSGRPPTEVRSQANAVIENVTIVGNTFSSLLPFECLHYDRVRGLYKQKTENSGQNVENVEDYYFNSTDEQTKVIKHTESFIYVNKEKGNLSSKENDKTVLNTDWFQRNMLTFKGNNSQDMFNNWTCSRDTACLRNGDCCMDVITDSLALNETRADFETVLEVESETCLNISLRELVRRVLREGSEKIIYTHALQFSSCQTADPASNIMMILRCPEGQTIEGFVREECENSSSPMLPPVTVNLTFVELTFLNVFCARCHGFNDTPLEVWQTELACKDSVIKSYVSLDISDLVAMVKTGLCHVTFSLPAGVSELGSCTPVNRVKDLRNGNFSSAEYAKEDIVLCTSYWLPIAGDQSQNGRICDIPNTENGFSSTVVQYPIRYNLLNTNDAHIEKFFPGGILIILDASGRYNQGNTMFYLCKSTQLFNHVSAKCVDIICPPWSEPYRGRCYNVKNVYFMENSTQNFPTGWKNLDVIWTISEHLDSVWCDRFVQLLDIWRKLIKQVSIGEFEYQISKIEQVGFGFSKCMNAIEQENSSGNLTLKISIKKDNVSVYFINDLKQMINFIENFNPNSSQISLTNMDNITQGTSCPNGDSPKQRKDFSLVEVKEVVYAVLNVTDVSIHYPLSHIGYGLIHQKLPNSSGTFSETIIVCETSQLFFRKDCTVVLYNLSETFQNGSRLEIPSSGQIYHERDFEIQGIQVFVCSKFQFEHENQKQNKAYVILSVIMSTLSVICLLLTLIIYCMFPEIRTLPGKMMASLALTLLLTLLSNTVSLVELHHDYICPILAVITHGITLAYFGWMSAIAINMALTFGPGFETLMKTLNHRQLFRRYNLVVWGSSVTIVISSAILDFTHRELNPSPEASNPTNVPKEVTASPSAQHYVSSLLSSYSQSPLPTEYPRYGIPYCTWFSGPLWSKLAFIVIPYVITFFINLVGFIITVIGLQRSRKLSQKLGRKPTDRTQCLIYIKLSTAMGFSWILSILTNIYPDCEVLPYIYMSLVLLQGVCLFLAFMVNKRVYTLIRATLSCYRQRHSDVSKNCEKRTGSSKNN